MKRLIEYIKKLFRKLFGKENIKPELIDSLYPGFEPSEPWPEPPESESASDLLVVVDEPEPEPEPLIPSSEYEPEPIQLSQEPEPEPIIPEPEPELDLEPKLIGPYKLSEIVLELPAGFYSTFINETGYYVYIGHQDQCRYLKMHIFNTIDFILKFIHIKYGIKTTIFEASSRIQGEGCKHPAGSHMCGRGLDIRYYGWEEGGLLLEPTWELFSLIHKLIPESLLETGVEVEKQLEKFSGQRLLWVIGADMYNHWFDPKNSVSHVHVGLGDSPVDWDAEVYTYSSIPMIGKNSI